MVMTTPRIGRKRKKYVKNQPGPVPLPVVTCPEFFPIQQAANGFVVAHYQPSSKGVAINTYAVYDEFFVTNDECVDRDSVHRKFGWGRLGNTHHIPFIYRNGDKYCAVRMVNKYILEDYIFKISDNIYFGCTNIPGYYATLSESYLLNEINNNFPCNNFFGAIPFKQGDVLVKLEDANQFYEFLLVCNNKLFNTPCDEKHCGFLILNGKSIPYVTVKGVKLVPLFYLDGMEDIKFKVKVIKDWSLSYLKFCFKVHGIHDEFCKSNVCHVISLDNLMQYLDPGDCVKEWWPTLLHSNKGVYQPKKINIHEIKPWHKHPITVLPVSAVKYSKVVPNRNMTLNVPTNGNVYYTTTSHS